VPVALFGYLLQGVALLVPPLYLGISLLPGFMLLSSQSIIVVALISPVLFALLTLSSALLLVAIKWIVLGKLKPGHTAVWSTAFAKRWIVGQCCRVCWQYTPWRFMKGTALLSTLHRCLGCNLGKGSHLDSNLIEDFDLVSVGGETSVEVTLVTGEVLVGVLTLLPIKIGSNCTLGYDSVIEPGSILENGVELSPRSLVTKNSHLKTRSLWQGKPATLVERDDIENDSKEQRRDASLQVEESENATLSLDSSSGNAARQKGYLLCQLFTLFVLTPYFAAIELGVAVLTGRVILHNLGWIGMSVLVWVPFTASTVVFMVIAICFKKLLLGKVHSGKWLMHGSFHRSRRKYVVDHFIRGHLLVWQEFASLVEPQLRTRLIFARESAKLLVCSLVAT